MGGGGGDSNKASLCIALKTKDNSSLPLVGEPGLACSPAASLVASACSGHLLGTLIISPASWAVGGCRDVPDFGWCGLTAFLSCP